jgi:two-component system cell cycle sensor histidine kinase/response regulator CckA
MSKFHACQVPQKKKGRILTADIPQELRPGFETAQALLNAHADRALLLDREGVILALNRTAAEALGSEAEALVGRNAFDLFIPETAKRRREYHDKVVRSGRPLRYEDQREARWLENHLHPVMGLGGQVVGVAVFSRDVTEIKQTEAELRSHRDRLEELVAERTAALEGANERLREEVSRRSLVEERLRTLADQSPFGLTLLRPDQTFAYLNPKFTEVFGYTIEDIPDKPTWFLKAYPEETYRREVVETWNRDSTRVAASSETVSRTFKVRCKDRGDKTILFRNVSLKDGMQLMTYEDVTLQTAAEKALRESEERYRRLYEESKRGEELYRTLIDSSPDAIVIHDLEGRVKYVCPVFTRIFGWTLEELEGKRIPFVPASEREGTMGVIRALFETGTACQGYETKRYTKDGRLIDISVSASRYHDHEGRPAGMLVTLRDISTRKALEAQLFQAHKMEAIGTLAGGVAHDFNNILQAITGFAQLLMMGKDPGDPDYPKIQAIEQAARKAGDLTRQLLVFSRKVEAKLRPLDLNHEVEQAQRLLERTIPKMIGIELHLSGDLGIINGDPVQIEQVMMNLAVNARDAMPDGGRLIFRTERVVLDEGISMTQPGAVPGEYVRLSISDTGHGMAPNVLEHIFEPFYTTKEAGKGTGLGLAMVYGIVKGHGGHIKCSSRVGEGTVFDLYFPIFQMEVSRPREERPEEVIHRGSETILLVDDEESLLDIGKETLKRQGYDVLTANSGEAAIEAYDGEGKTVDLVILDLNMPGMGGLKCLAALRDMNPRARVIIASGYLADDQLRESVRFGASAFVAKPYKLSDLLKAIREVLDRVRPSP